MPITSPHGSVADIGLGLLITLLLASVWIDVKQRKIPNQLVSGGLVTALGVQMFIPGGTLQWLLGLLVGLVLLFPLYRLRVMGAGDVKLMAMVGAFIGPAAAAGAVLTTLVAGGVLGVAWAFWTKNAGRLLTNLSWIFRNLPVGPGADTSRVRAVMALASVGNLPYAVAIAAGTFIQLYLQHIGRSFF